MPILFHSFLKKEIKAISVFIIGENVLSTVTAHHYVIYCAYKMQSWFPCHAVTISQRLERIKESKA